MLLFLSELLIWFPQAFILILVFSEGLVSGFSASYSWQTIFNTLGAVYIASAIFGPWGAVLLRITANVFATAYALGFQEIFKKIAVHFPSRERSFE